MASKEIQDQVKKKLFEDWMPDKPGGLKGLVNMAADAALAAIAERAVVVEQKMRERVEFLEDELEAAVERAKIEIDQEGMDSLGDLSQFVGPVGDPGDDSDDAEPCASVDPKSGLTCEDSEDDHDGSHYAENDQEESFTWDDQEPEVDQTQYRCPQCDVTHRRDSDVGTRHAHLFYGGTPAVVHLELCPVLEDSEATCNCNAVPASADQRAADRRPHDRF